MVPSIMSMYNFKNCVLKKTHDHKTIIISLNFLPDGLGGIMILRSIYNAAEGIEWRSKESRSSLGSRFSIRVHVYPSFQGRSSNWWRYSCYIYYIQYMGDMGCTVHTNTNSGSYICVQEVQSRSQTCPPSSHLQARQQQPALPELIITFHPNKARPFTNLENMRSDLQASACQPSYFVGKAEIGYHQKRVHHRVTEAFSHPLLMSEKR